ncbi:MFS general substrate transporter [Mycena indigotica]|uniref:MFS general substrate transporter n=1 Tax=Mycena indigotica TaxID=2126181 RepID=A0A8H6RZU3_9AGAR|nr:MFS general substrate transporter [Mycena indigotica]KAF7289718.1 MFS general substrate transporter [Mycena indigotica]
MEKHTQDETYLVPQTTAGATGKRDLRFWGVIAAIMVSAFTSALDLTSVSTALPVITRELHGTQFVWVGSAYALSSTAFLPMSGGVAEVFGRRIVMIAALFFFALGSVLCGAAPSMNFLIVGRTIQGLGAGGLTSLTQIVLSDLVSLKDRGLFSGLLGLAWAIASFIGPVIGGVLADHGAWRWLFYLNIFTSVFAAVLVFLFLRLRTPTGTVKEKLMRIDWIGNLLVISASSAVIIALTWGGIQYPWSSPRVLTPLILGTIGLIGFFVYEANVAVNPIVPFSLMSTLTGLSGYLQTFVASIVMIATIYYLPVYFQACHGSSPTASGVDTFGLGFVIAPSNIVAGITIARTKHYRPQLWLSWIIVMIAAGLLSTLHAESSRARTIGYEVFIGVGIGILTTGTYFPVLAPLPVSENAHALAFFIFTRAFGQVWGVTIGAAVLQNYLGRHLPAAFDGAFPQGTEIAYAAIPLIKTLPPDLAQATREAFASALSVVWLVMIGIAGLGLLTSLLMKHLTLHGETNEKWGVDDKNNSPISPTADSESGDVELISSDKH